MKQCITKTNKDMKKMIMATLFVALLVGISATTEARPDFRQRHQKHSIHRGVRSGQITPREAHRLHKEQRHISSIKRKAYADGYVTHRERARIVKAERRAHRNIYVAKHNRHRRY